MNLLIEPLVRAALLEDLGRAGDITTEACVRADARGEGVLAARVAGTIAGLDLASMAFRLVDDGVRFTPRVRDGESVAAGAVIADVQGPARGLLTGERVALNFLGHLSGIATATRGIADAIAHTACRVVCTRKTTPGLRAVEKYAVRCGGGQNHRFGLDDAILIGHLIKIEIEVDTLSQLSTVLEVGADAVLLDNMSLDQLRAAVEMVAGRMETEASGGITPARAPGVAETGVDFMSVGWLTHSVRTLDIGLDF